LPAADDYTPHLLAPYTSLVNAWGMQLGALICLCAVAVACSAPAEHPALREAALAPLIAAHRFAYQGEVVRGYQLSPDGRRLAWIGPFLRQSRLYVRDTATGETSRHRIGSYGFHWSPDARRILYMSDPSGAENTRVYMIDVEERMDAVDLTPYPGVTARIHRFVAGRPNELLVYHNRRDPRVSDLYRIDLDTGEETLVARNPGDAVGAITSAEGLVLRWQRSREAGRPAAERRLPLIMRLPGLAEASDETFRVLGRSADGKFIWALSSRGRERTALVAAHPTLGWEKIVFEDPHVDVSRVDMSHVTGDPLIAYADPGYPRHEILDPALREDLAELLAGERGAPFGLEIVSRDATEKRLVVLIYTTAQQRYYLVDRDTRKHTLLAVSLADDVADALVPMQPVMFSSRDGLPLQGYLMLPHGAPRRGLPMVLLVHGGPWQRTTWGNPLRSDDAAFGQFLANRGYAVLLVNFRGSTGYGQRFLTAARGEFGGRMQDDLLDATAWAVDAGIADAGRIAIMGWSYGGYAALVGLTATPEVFACGVSLGGPTDLATMIESFPAYWKVDLSMWHDYVGNPALAEDRAAMDARSPLHYADRLERPVLIVHGGNDVRVRSDQAERMVAALRGAGKPVEYLPIPEMGHGMGYWAHRLAILRATETFLRGCLGGRASRVEAFDAVAWAWTRMAWLRRLARGLEAAMGRAVK
jgi:dipeptidyl aminopeptidase/acylaminoacyl peptidase